MSKPELIHADDPVHYTKLDLLPAPGMAIKAATPESIARAMQVEYEGQAERELAPTIQFALNAKAKAMGEFLQRLRFIAGGERG